MKSTSLKTILIFIILIGLVTTLHAQNPSISFENVRHGFITKVENETLRYYFLNAKIKIAKGSNLTILQNTCTLIGKDGKKLTKCYVYCADKSFGFSEYLIFPLDVKTFYVWGLLAESKEQQWANMILTNSVSDSAGSITYSNRYEKELDNYIEGSIELFFLWEVPNGFIPKSIVLSNLFKLDF
jgi:RPA family protein